MAFKKLFAVLALAFVVARALPLENEESQNSTPSEEINYRLPKDTVPKHYDIKLIPHIVEENFTFDGEANVDFEVLRATPDVALHTEDLTLDEGATKLTSKTGDTRVPKQQIHDNVTDITTFRFDEPLEPGVYTLGMKFRGTLNGELNGFYRTSYRDDRGETVWMATTQFEPTSARRAFPCWDEPALKATFNISIKHPTNYTALSNMPAYKTSEIDETDGKVWTHFERTPVMSSYLVAFVVADYKNVSNEDNTINVWCRKELIPNSKLVHEIAQKAAVALEEYTNSSVRVPKMDHVSIPQHAAGAMENWGLITYPDSVFSYEEGKDTLYKKELLIRTVIHELTHQWFGNVVSPTWWNHLWLNEGFATYFESYIIDKIFDGQRAEENFVMSVVRESLSDDVPAHMTPIDANVTTPDEIHSAFSLVAYGKAPSILRMLANIVSPDVFRAGLVKYLNAHDYEAANPDCLWTAIQKALDESAIPHDDYNVKEVMDSWINLKRYPLVTVRRNYSTGETIVSQQDNGLVEIHDHDDDTDTDEAMEDYSWWIPINYATKENLDFSDTKPSHWLKPRQRLIIDGIDANDWIIINKQQTGYYRVNYDVTNWERIADYLRTQDFKKIHVLNRAQLLQDATALMESDQLSMSILLKLMSYLTRETDYIAWYPVLNNLYRVSYILQMPGATAAKEWLLKLMDNLIKDVGFEQHPDDSFVTVTKRIETLNWMCELGHPDCTRMANVKLVEHLNDPETHKITPDLKEWTYCMGLREANESVWNKVRDLYVKTESKDLLRYLSCSLNPVIIEEFLNMSLSNETKIPEGKRILMYYMLFENTAMLDTEIDFVKDNWDRMEERLERPGSIVYGIAERVTTEDQLQKLEEICKKNGVTKKNTEYILSERRNKIAKYTALIQEWIKMAPKL